ncbi:hypothetical protein Bbelb_049430 [Branchiostoma belcheri]|nr:hypothetical protein Bbelb_049430 [Branchiostoma belcheri]
METLGVIKHLVRPGDFMAKLDLKDAYFTIPVDADSRRFLTFQWQGRFYQFQCLPFGVATAPRVFTKVLKVPVAILRRRGFRLVVYLDDILVIGRSREACREALWAAIELLSGLGFVPNLEKSVLEPSQRITFLGSGIDTTQMVTFLPESKVLELQQLAHDVLTADRGMSARELASVIGRLQATTTSVWLAPLHFRSLQRLLITVLRVTRGHWEQLVPLTESARADLKWWTDHLPRHNSRPILSPAADIVVETDASTAGWGGYSNGVHTGGRWSVEEGQAHINILELRAASLTVRAFCRELVSKHVKVLTDNVTVVAYLNRLGGTRSQRLLDIALDLWEWCVNRDLYITAEHVPGKENVRADYNSRHFSPATEWTLDRHTFLGLQATFPRLMKGVDLFASDISTTHEGGGSVRVPNKLPATSVCVLASRARGNRDRCVHNELEQVGSAIRFSPVHASRTNSKESARRHSSPASRSSDLGHSSLVPSPAGDAGRRTSVTTSPQQSPDAARVRDASPRGHKNATSRLACLRSQHDMYGISPEVSKILLASWRAGTQKLYASAWDKWSGWCDQRHIHPVSAPLNKVLDFLISLYDKGFQYRTINVYRSAISTTHLPLEGQPLGSHPLMAKTVLQEAGIDTSRFTGHSTRGASVSAAARQGVSTKDILAAANWSTASTFKKFYNRPVGQTPSLTGAVLHEFRHDPSREGFGQVELKNFRLVRMRREAEANKDIFQQQKISRLEMAHRESMAVSSKTMEDNRKEIDSLTKQLSDLQAKLQHQTLECQQAVHEKEKAVAKLEDYKVQIRDLENLHASHATNTSRHQNMDPDKMVKIIKQLELNLDLTKQKVQKLESDNKKLQELEDMCDRLQFAKSQLQGEVERSKLALETEREQNSIQQRRNNSSNAEMAEMRRQVEKSAEEARTASVMLAAKEDEIKAVQQELEAARNKLQQDSGSSQELQRTIMELKQQLQSAEHEVEVVHIETSWPGECH